MQGCQPNFFFAREMLALNRVIARQRPEDQLGPGSSELSDFLRELEDGERPRIAYVYGAHEVVRSVHQPYERIS